jgi:hypothetical protein
MSILWCGGEDVDFPNGSAINVVTNTSYFRSSFSRCSISSGVGVSSSNAFPGGSVTSCWFSFQLGFFPENSNGSQRGGALTAGISNTAVATNGTGIYVYTTAGFGIGIAKFDGTTTTVLASGSNSTIPNSTQVQRMDMQVVNYGTSSIITLWMNGAIACTFSGNSTVGSLSSFNCVVVSTSPSGNFGALGCGSEFLVADEDTRFMAVKTCAPLALGTTASWSGVVGNVNPAAITDANSVSVNATAQDEQFTQNGLPTGTWSVRQIKVTSRGAASAGAVATKFTPGFRLAGSVVLTGGTTHSPGTAFGNFEDFWTNNPVSGVAWTPTDVATGNLQLELQSS